MECRNAKRRLSDYLDGAVSSEERRLLKNHFNACRECALASQRYGEVRRSLRSLPQRVPPSDLTTRLRVVASKVRMEAIGGASPWRRWRDRLELSLQNLMRPLAVPAVGGLCSAVFLFSTLIPTFRSSFLFSDVNDIPTMLSTQPMLKYTAPIAFSDRDAVVDLRLDNQGRVVDFTIVSAPGEQTENIRRHIENHLLFTEFWPATTFGQGVPSKIRISFSSYGIVVKG
ncbi:MAG TPA: zf-HC2 domain-containing protein [Bryobacteraceae bacterium]|nr:zf-HC2 domain-containing protein [Bryobacteraceae bacterium]